MLKPAAVASVAGARSGGGFNKGLFSYKKEERLNRLNFLNRKRQILTVNRQNRAVNGDTARSPIRSSICKGHLGTQSSAAAWLIFIQFEKSTFF